MHLVAQQHQPLMSPDDQDRQSPAPKQGLYGPVGAQHPFRADRPLSILVDKTDPARRPGRRGERGQGLVEFSLMVVFLSILLMGVLDLGRAYYSYLAIK